MEGRRDSGSFPRGAAPPVQAPPENYYQQQQPSYRRYPKQPQAPYPPRGERVPYADEPIYQPTYPPAPPQNSSTRSNSHRRRSSQPYPVPSNGQPTNFPQAPEAPRAPPVSYREPYMGSFAAPARSRSHRRYEPAPAKVRSSSADNYVTASRPYEPSAPPVRTDFETTSSRPYDAPLMTTPQDSPISPTTGYGERKASSGSVGITRRRGSVSNRSPLQKLEGALDDISKEEKRARIEEAEAQAQDKATSRRTSQSSSRNVSLSGAPQRHVSGPAQPGPGPSRVPSDKRNVSLPTTGPVDPRRPEKGTNDFGSPYRPEQQQYGAPNSRTVPQRKAQVPQYDGPIESRRVHGGHRLSGDGGRSAGFRDRTAPAGPSTVRQEVPPRDYTAPAIVATGAGLGLSGIDDHANDEQNSANFGRSNSRRLQKRTGPPEEEQPTGSRDSGKMPAAHKQMASDRVGHARGARAAARYQDPDPFPMEAVRNPHAAVPKYEVPPQTAGGQQARDQVGFSREDPARMAPVTHEHYHHLPNLFHRHHHDERRYMSNKPLDEWRSAGVASLAADDLDVPDTAASADPKQTWWERGTSQRGRTGSEASPTTSHFDGAYEEPRGQTHFSPPLYLKCGPLLRYRGMHRESRVGRNDKWIWRGSVMIVTIDNHSSYEKPPTLRLFVQPKDLLPPPPAQLDAGTDQELAPEYVDPLAGEFKTSRTGKTLYVRPVEDLEEQTDLSRREDDTGLFEESRTAPLKRNEGASRSKRRDGEKAGRFREVKGHRLHAERGVTFWRFNLEVELGNRQARLAYRINKGPAIGFWVPARGETMNIMFHSCNGFSLSVDSNQFCGPDPLWRDVLNNHQTRPFHVMIGGGDQIYNDAATRQTTLFKEWLSTKNPAHKHSAEFTAEMQDELEDFYLNRYAMWFSQGFFGMANSQIPMINLWDDHDIIDGYGSYPHHFMKNPVFTGLGAVAFKYYMLFQHQSVVDETEVDEPSWLLGAAPGPYINELSRNLFMFLGQSVAFVGLDCRTERMRDEILSADTYYAIFERCRKEIKKGETKHLIVLLGVPIAYPRLNFLENVLTSRVMDPIKALGRTGMLGGFVNKFDGGVEILDDLDDHWTAKHHKPERNWFIQELQELAADKSVRITILGGDVHLAAVGQFYSNKKLGIPKDHDHRYMPNIISSAIVNTPPPELMGDILNKRNKVHHLDEETDENMIPMFTHDVDGKPRNNIHLLPRRNWCSIREYKPGSTPPVTRTPSPSEKEQRPGGLTRTLSLTRKDFTPGGLVRRFSNKGGPPPAMYNNQRDSPHSHPGQHYRSPSADAVRRPSDQSTSYFPPRATGTSLDAGTDSRASSTRPAPAADPPRPNPFHRMPTGLSIKAARKGGAFDADSENSGQINLENGLDIVLNLEVSQKDPAGITTPYRLLVPALDYRGQPDINVSQRKKSLFAGIFGTGSKRRDEEHGYDSRSLSPDSRNEMEPAAYSDDEHSYDERSAPQQPSQPVTYGNEPVQARYGPRKPSYEDRYGDEYDEGSEGSEGAERRSFEEKPKKKPGWKIWR